MLHRDSLATSLPMLNSPPGIQTIPWGAGAGAGAGLATVGPYLGLVWVSACAGATGAAGFVSSFGEQAASPSTSRAQTAEEDAAAALLPPVQFGDGVDFMTMGNVSE
jgi:hypothetical protein